MTTLYSMWMYYWIEMWAGSTRTHSRFICSLYAAHDLIQRKGCGQVRLQLDGPVSLGSEAEAK